MALNYSEYVIMFYYSKRYRWQERRELLFLHESYDMTIVSPVFKSNLMNHSVYNMHVVSIHSSTSYSTTLLKTRYIFSLVELEATTLAAS